LKLATPRCLFSLPTRRPPSSTLFPYTTLFRSAVDHRRLDAARREEQPLEIGAAARIADRHVELGARELVGEISADRGAFGDDHRSEERTSELQSLTNLVCRLLLEKKTRHE